MEGDIKKDPFVVGLLSKLPEEERDSFSPDQLMALKVALGGRAWGAHAVDLRWTMKFWRWRYYFVFLAGRNRRDLSQRQEHVARLAMATFLTIFLMISTLLGLLVLYLIKSALGIDLIPGHSFGVWTWFKDSFL